MKLLYIILVAIFFFPSYTMSIENPGEQVETKRPGSPVSNTSMSKVLEYLLIEAQKMELDNEQRKRLIDVRNKYLVPLIRKEADYNLTRLKVVDMMQNPDFDTEKLKVKTKELKEQAWEMSEIAIDALDEIRDVVGLENFRKLMTIFKPS